jgi:predicted membrane GTPase involved in stress response
MRLNEPATCFLFKVYRKWPSKRHRGRYRGDCGLEGIEIGDNIGDAENPVGLPPIRVEGTNRSHDLCVNTLAFSPEKKEKFSTSRNTA